LQYCYQVFIPNRFIALKKVYLVVVSKMIETRIGTKNKAVKIKDLAKAFNELIKSEIKESSTNTCNSEESVLTSVGKMIKEKKNEKDGKFNKELPKLLSLLEKPTCNGDLRDLVPIIWYLKSLFNITKKDIEEIEEVKNKSNSNSKLKSLLQRPHLDLRIPIFMSVLGDIYEEIWDYIKKNINKEDKRKLRPASFRSFFTGKDYKRRGIPNKIYTISSILGVRIYEDAGQNKITFCSGNYPNLFLPRFIFALNKLNCKEEIKKNRLENLQEKFGFAINPRNLILLTLILLDAIANPLCYLNKLYYEYLKNNKAYSKHNNRIKILDNGLKLLIFAMAKASYDGLSCWKDESPLFIEKIFQSQEDENKTNKYIPCVPIPVLLHEESTKEFNESTLTINFADTLWGQFNYILFIEGESKLIDTGKEKPKQGNYWNKEAEPIRKIGLKTNIGSVRTVYYDKLIVYHTKMHLPLKDEYMNFEWNRTYLGSIDKLDGFVGEFVQDLMNSEDTTVMLMLVGPYGTGKTTTAQIVALALVDHINDDWHILSYNPKGDNLVLKKLNATNISFFKKTELSRAIRLRDITSKLSINEDINDISVIINLSELNAKQEVDNVVLENIENIIREIKEKIAPKRFVILISAQTAHLIMKYRQYLEGKPDMILGSARLDYIHICRLDVPQWFKSTRAKKIKATAKFDFLCNFIDKMYGHKELVEGFGISSAQLASLLLMKTSAKIHLLKRIAKEIEHVKPYGKINHILKAIQKIKNDQMNNRENKYDYVLEWASDATFFDLFKYDIGTYSTISLYLLNGFIRQLINTINNEILLLKELRNIARSRKVSGQYLLTEIATKFFIMARIEDNKEKWSYLPREQRLSKTTSDIYPGFLPSNATFDLAISLGKNRVVFIDITTDPKVQIKRLIEKVNKFIKKRKLTDEMRNKKWILINIIFDFNMMLKKLKKLKKPKKSDNSNCSDIKKLINLGREVRLINGNYANRMREFHASLIPDIIYAILESLEERYTFIKVPLNKDKDEKIIIFADICMSCKDLHIISLKMIVPILEQQKNNTKNIPKDEIGGLLRLMIKGRVFSGLNKKLLILPYLIITYKETEELNVGDHHIYDREIMCHEFRERFNAIETLIKAKSREKEEKELIKIAFYQLNELCGEKRNIKKDIIELKIKKLCENIEKIMHLDEETKSLLSELLKSKD